MKPIIVDPGLYLSEGTEMFYATQKRELPSAYRLFTGMYAWISLKCMYPRCFLFLTLFDASKSEKNVAVMIMLWWMTGNSH